ncbi:MAG: hypothetical protein M1820_007438 [Bogoriella megaspora]|nr:MAG: hypothetical protein M1820_007438 [Bogoriella megaspora]
MVLAISILYPYDPNAVFDLAYYLTHHIPLLESKWKARGLKACHVIRCFEPENSLLPHDEGQLSYKKQKYAASEDETMEGGEDVVRKGEGRSDGERGQAVFTVNCIMYWESKEAWERALEVEEETREIVQDVGNFSSVGPLRVIGEVVRF